jgi:hypothetical protein
MADANDTAFGFNYFPAYSPYEPEFYEEVLSGRFSRYIPQASTKAVRTRLLLEWNAGCAQVD